MKWSEQQECEEIVANGIIKAARYLADAVQCYEQVKGLPNCGTCKWGAFNKKCLYNPNGAGTDCEKWAHVNCPHYEEPKRF